MHPTRSAGVALLLAAAWLFPVRAWAQQGSQGARRDPEMEAPEVKRVTIRGVERVDEDVLRDGIATEASSCNSALYRYTICLLTKSSAVYTRRYLDREELALDVLRMRVFYWRRGFREAQVDTLVEQLSPDEVAVTFDVREGPPTVVGSVVVEGVDTLLARRRLDELVLLEPGEPFSMLELDTTVVNVRTALWDLGYADAIVDTAVVVDTAQRTAAVRVVADPRWLARVGRISIEGLDELDSTVVRNSLTLRPGDVFEREELFRSQRNLYESGLFRRAVIETGGEDSVKALAISVVEADMQRARASAGFNTIDFVQVDGRYTHFNFLGGARRLTLQGTVGNLLARQLEDEFIFQRAVDPNFSGDADPFLRPSWLVSAEVRQPWFRSPLNTLSLSAFAHRRVTPLVVVDRGQGATATFTREVAPRANASLSYRFETTRIEAGDVYFCVNFGVCDVATIRTLTGTQRLSPALLLGNVDRSDDPLAPTRGYRARVELEHANDYTGSDYRYSRSVLEGSVYRPLGRGVAAARVRVGRTWPHAEGADAPEEAPLFGEDVIHPRKRFYAGGSRSVRGFGEGQLGPRVLTVAPSTLRGEREVDGQTVYERCAPEIPITECPLAFGEGTPPLRAENFTARPLGSPAVLELNVEYRMRVWGPLVAAVFVDGAVLPAGDDAFFTLEDNFMALTPGFGVRYESPVGPIRVDVGINPSGPEDLPVFTELLEGNGVRRIVQVGRGLPLAERPTFRYDPVGEAGSGWRKLMSRLVLHLSIGEAF